MYDTMIHYVPYHAILCYVILNYFKFIKMYYRILQDIVSYLYNSIGIIGACFIYISIFPYCNAATRQTKVKPRCEILGSSSLSFLRSMIIINIIEQNMRVHVFLWPGLYLHGSCVSSNSLCQSFQQSGLQCTAAWNDTWGYDWLTVGAT